MNDLFSERYGYIAKKLQYEYINEFSKAHLWDQINWHFIAKAKRMFDEQEKEIKVDVKCADHAVDFYFALNKDFWGRSVDEVTVDTERIKRELKNIVFNSMWFSTFDLIEGLVRLYPELIPDVRNRKKALKSFQASINQVLDEQRCAYKMMNGLIVPKVNDLEVTTIVNSLVDTTEVQTVNSHLEQAIKHYSDRQNPDYKNAMKEAIAALEAQLKIMTNKPSIGMSQALTIIGKNSAFELHPMLILSLEKLYNWSSDASGIRHANKVSSNLEYQTEDAKLIIITCCSFVSYLIAKSNKNGITLK